MSNAITKCAAVAGVVALTSTLPAVADSLDVRTIANLANNCYSCHGPAGRSPGSIPSIHTLNARRIEMDLKHFRSGERKSTVMGRMARAYSDQEIEAIAHFIADTNAPTPAAR